MRRYDVGVFEYDDPVIRVGVDFNLPDELGITTHDSEFVTVATAIERFVNRTEDRTVDSGGIGHTGFDYLNWSDGRRFSIATRTNMWVDDEEGINGTDTQTITVIREADGSLPRASSTGPRIDAPNSSDFSGDLTSAHASFQDNPDTENRNEAGTITYSWSGLINRLALVRDQPLNDQSTLIGINLDVPNGDIIGRNEKRTQMGTVSIPELRYQRAASSHVFRSGPQRGWMIPNNVNDVQLEQIIVEKEVVNLSSQRVGSMSESSEFSESEGFTDPITFSYHGRRGEYESVAELQLKTPWERMLFFNVQARFNSPNGRVFNIGALELRCRSLIAARVRVTFTQSRELPNFVFDQVNTPQIVLESYGGREIPLLGGLLGVRVASVIEDGRFLLEVEKEVLDTDGALVWVHLTEEEIECSLDIEFRDLSYTRGGYIDGDEANGEAYAEFAESRSSSGVRGYDSRDGAPEAYSVSTSSLTRESDRYTDYGFNVGSLNSIRDEGSISGEENPGGGANQVGSSISAARYSLPGYAQINSSTTEELLLTPDSVITAAANTNTAVRYETRGFIAVVRGTRVRG